MASVKSRALGLIGIFVLGFLGLSPAATIGQVTVEPMRFTIGSEPQQCDDPGCGGWIDAVGEITPDTPAAFKQFLGDHKPLPAAIRFISPGGDLVASMTLGQMIRRAGLNAEADICVAACAYAFLGGVERTFVGKPTAFGIHRLYQNEPSVTPTPEQLAGTDLDEKQRAMAGLMLYALEMDVDLRLLTISSEAGPNDVRWIRDNEARELNIIRDPNKWKPWEISPYLNGLVAHSERGDGEAYMQISCSQKQGGAFTLVDREGDRQQFAQCAAIDRHPILGLIVSNARHQIGNNDAPLIHFFLGNTKPTLESASVFNDKDLYPAACITDRYAGTTQGLKAAGELALRNCIE